MCVSNYDNKRCDNTGLIDDVYDDDISGVVEYKFIYRIVWFDEGDEPNPHPSVSFTREIDTRWVYNTSNDVSDYIRIEVVRVRADSPSYELAMKNTMLEIQEELDGLSQN